jgi:hypothetical protein
MEGLTLEIANCQAGPLGPSSPCYYVFTTRLRCRNAFGTTTTSLVGRLCSATVPDSMPAWLR